LTGSNSVYFRGGRVDWVHSHMARALTVVTHVPWTIRAVWCPR